MKTQPSRTIYNGLRVLKLREIACKSHMILSTSEKGRNKKTKNKHTESIYSMHTEAPKAV